MAQTVVSSDKSLLNIQLIHNYLSHHSYWAKGIPESTVKRSIENSLCFGVYIDGKQVGFARIVSDFATFAYLADVFILPGFRGQGLSKLLVAEVLNHPSLQGLRRVMLGTLDAHSLYARFGFKALSQPDRFMEIRAENPYGCAKDGGGC